MKKFVLLIILIILGLSMYFLKIPPQTSRDERVTLAEGYYFNVTIPPGYKLTEGKGDYANYVEDFKGNKLIGFAKSSAGGEHIKFKPITIDGVPLDMESSKTEIGCPMSISQKDFNPKGLNFGIITWCIGSDENQSPVYKQIIDSIVFGSNLREFLLKNSEK